MKTVWLAFAFAFAFGLAPRSALAGPGVEAFVGLPAVEDVTVSPDGSTLAYVRRDGGTTKVIAQTRAGEVLAAVDAGDQKLFGLRWVSPDHVAISWRATAQLAITRNRYDLEVVDILNVRTRGYVRALRRADHKAYNAIFGWSPGTHNGEPVLYMQAYTEEEGDVTLDLYRVELDTGRGWREQPGANDTRDYLVDSEGAPLARVAYQSDNGLWRLSTRSGGSWRQIMSESAPLDLPKLSGFGRTLDTVMIQHDEQGQSVLTEVALTDGSERDRLIFPEQPDQYLYKRTGELVGVAFPSANSERIFDPRLAQAWAVLRDALPGKAMRLVSFSDDYNVLVGYGAGAGDSGTYYLYDGAAQRVSIVGRDYPGVRGADVATVQTIEYKAADGTDLTGYLTLPPGRDPHNLPVIVLPHGGPQSRDYNTFDWWAQLLASRGYAVFQPQFRGSDGFGATLLEAGYGQWGRKMQSDVSDGFRFLAAQGVVDPARACIMGGSYGGYVALAGMTMEPGTYRCGVSIAGVADLREMLLWEQRQGANGDENPSVRYWKRFMGADGPDDRSLDERSPTHLANRAQGPILLIHGQSDITVPFAQSQMMLQALGGEGPKVHLVTLPGEDHFLSSPATRLQAMTAAVTFLEANNPPN